LAEPKVKPRAPPAPAPTAAGRFTAKFGAPETPVADAVPRSEPPVTRTVLGKVQAGGVAAGSGGLSEAAPLHADGAEKLVLASTIRLSISTWGVIESSFSTRLRALPMLLPMSRTTRVLVRGSTATGATLGEHVLDPAGHLIGEA
jgi:hypothetical protein